VYATVVIPFYNAEATLSRAIDSVLAQENVTLQILLIDNNSTDRSVEIAKTYVSKYESITLHMESKQGANNARNLGLALATYDWIQYLDADDELLPTKIVNQLSIYQISKIDVVVSPIIEHIYAGDTIEYTVDQLGDIWLSLLRGKIGWTCSNLWRKSALQSVGGWNLDYTSHQEKELMARLIVEDKSFFFYNSAECKVYEQKKSISKRSDFPLTGIKFMKYLANHFEVNDLWNLNRKKALHTQLYHKYLMAYKVDPTKAKDAMYRVKLETGIIDLPAHHQVLINLFGIDIAFWILRNIKRRK